MPSERREKALAASLAANSHRPSTNLDVPGFAGLGVQDLTLRVGEGSSRRCDCLLNSAKGINHTNA